MVKLLLIALGGAAGTLGRYLLIGWVQRFGDGTFPLGTLSVNVIGCFFIAIMHVALLGPLLMREEYRLALLVGLLGGFTTFSTFGMETFALINAGAWRPALGNVLLSNVLGLTAAWAGYRLGEWWFGALS